MWYTIARPARNRARPDRHAEHGRFINEVCASAELLDYVREKVLDEVYERLEPRGLSR